MAFFYGAIGSYTGGWKGPEPLFFSRESPDEERRKKGGKVAGRERSLTDCADFRSRSLKVFQGCGVDFQGYSFPKKDEASGDHLFIWLPQMV